ncbi:5'-methylthioadenosine/S-adenosylhomocysteine nucleosidase family protein [Bacteroides salyersiae]|uniref:5'-methylthioadenosine/S-adenosylhomocysteine nucleosidase family protein n=1 Tax=Bacteroides salyersiae TaxID=291644 RepID=UPI001CD00C09|nr:hypothetical protein [Bacteroides salyersiae]UBD14509.1 hypothetical protein K6V19_10010 [Bacteroides salyersiae]
MDRNLLSIFESKIQKNIISFCKEINESQADLYIIMARKAACLISVLEKLSLITLRGDVISERVMDSNIDWQNYNKIIIIDDVVISGTTLYKTINRIKKFNSHIDIKLFILGVNDYWFNNDILNQDGVSYIKEPVRKLNNSECIRLSGDIVRLLAKYPVPYNIDYPIYNTLKLTDKEYKKVLTMPGWQIAEVTSFAPRTDGVFTHTFIPQESILEACGSTYTSDFIKESLLKIRTYGRSRKDKKHNYHFLTIIPMIIMPPIAACDLDNLFKNITKNERILTTLNSYTAKLRFIQFILADVIARHFLEEINLLLDKDTTVEREYSSLRYLFPSSIISDVVEAAEHFMGNIEMPLLEKHITTTEGNKRVNNILDVNQILYSPFIDMYYQDEIPSRKLVYEKGVNVFNEESYQNIINRLNRGVSITYLLDLLNDLPANLRLSFVSAFLDNAIDEGIVVPITVYENGIVYRAFRHGEDVQFCQQEERLCYDMLYAFANTIKQDSLQKLWIEKLLVLLFQLGEGNIFEPLQMDINPYRHIKGIEKIEAASVRYYLQGPVIIKTPVNNIIDKPYLEYSDKANWLTSFLLKNNRSPLKLLSNGMYAFDLEKYEMVSKGDYEIVVDSKKVQFAKSIGRIFGTLLSNGLKKQSPSINSDQLVALTSSIETKNVIGALAAEINICTRTWTTGKDNIQSIINDLLYKHTEISKKLKSIHKSAWHQALNDGIRKFLWYSKGTAYEIISDISINFEDDLYKDTWDGLWSPNLEKRGNEEYSQLKELADTEGLWLLCVNAYFLILEYFIQKRENTDFDEKSLLERINKVYAHIKQFNGNRLVREIIPIILYFKSKKYDNEYIENNVVKIFDRLISLFNRSIKILEDASDVFSQSSKIPNVQNYHHALYIEVETEQSVRIVNHLYSNIKFKMEKSTDDINTNIRMIPKSDSIMPFLKHFIFISYNEQGAFWLLQLAKEAMAILRSQSKLKVFFFPHLPTDCHIKYINDIRPSYQLFWEFIMTFIEVIQTTSFNRNIIYEIIETRFDEKLSDFNPGLSNYTRSFIEEKDVYIPNNQKYNIIKYSKNEEDMEIKKMDLGILTIVDEEARAVINGFNINIKKPLFINHKYYDEGYLDVENKHISIVHRQCNKQGNISMAVEFLDMQKEFNPSYMILLGIAGSIQDKIELCDVVICNDVLYYEHRKETNEGIERRLEHFNMSPTMNTCITRFRLMCDKPFQASEGSFQETFNLHISPVGTGEAVVGKELSETKKWLLTVNRKTGIVETEAAGFTAAFQDGTNDVNDILIIRGISDKADEGKNDDWRQAASNNAVLVLKKFIEDILVNHL